MMGAGPTTDLPVVPDNAEIKSKYLSLQQDADFALWRAREGNLEMRRIYDLALRGEGDPPSPAQLEELREQEQKAEACYRELRSFAREHFESFATRP
jgi:hypothetical protein